MIQSSFAHAVRKRQLSAFFEPVIELATGTIVAVEARARLSVVPTGAPASAREVLARARQAHAEWLLDQAMLNNAIEALQQLAGSGVELPLRVNLTDVTARLHSQELIEFLHKVEVPPERLALEVPATAFVEASTSLSALVAHVNGLGISVILDHFNSAVHSYVQDWTGISGIKLDENLVARASIDGEVSDQLERACALAHERRIRVGAEGLVRMDQINLLKKLGCDEAQGPLISRPRSLGVLTPLLRQGSVW
ncbi:MAG: EAL domain-containing protein [Pseudomonadales bacterium]